MAVVRATELISHLSNPRKAPRAILVHGADRSAVYELCQRVVKKVIESGDETLNVSRLSEAQISGSPGRLFEEFSSVSMFGGNRVIWVSAAGDNLAKSLDPILAGEAGGNLILIDAEALPNPPACASSLKPIRSQPAWRFTRNRRRNCGLGWNA
jgi:DNA polymerase-3 subunit delta